jgi:chorismate dehydratase
MSDTGYLLPGTLLEWRVSIMRKLRISAISFLNTAPLMWDFEQGLPPVTGNANAGVNVFPQGVGSHVSGTPLAGDFEVEYTIPSHCADLLRAGEADIGIIPAATYASIPDLAIVPDVAIAAKGPVRSILLISKVPREQIRTLAADISSRTSVALTRVLFHHWCKRAPEFVPAEPHLESMLARCDAALLIGDPALRVDRSRHHTWDLAEEWQQWTGKPFVFAFWAVRRAALAETRPELDIAAVFQSSRDHGVEPKHLSFIAETWSSHVGVSPAEICDYLTRHIYFWLDDECRAGLELFFHYAAECVAIPPPPPLRFLETARFLLPKI